MTRIGELDVPTQDTAWYAYLRLSGPLERYFNRSWPLPDIGNNADLHGQGIGRGSREIGATSQDGACFLERINEHA